MERGRVVAFRDIPCEGVGQGGKGCEGRGTVATVTVFEDGSRDVGCTGITTLLDGGSAFRGRCMLAFKIYGLINMRAEEMDECSHLFPVAGKE